MCACVCGPGLWHSGLGRRATHRVPCLRSPRGRDEMWGSLLKKEILKYWIIEILAIVLFAHIRSCNHDCIILPFILPTWPVGLVGSWCFLHLSRPREDRNAVRIRTHASRGVGQAIAMTTFCVCRRQTRYVNRSPRSTLHRSHHDQTHLYHLNTYEVVVFFLSERGF